MPHSHESCVTLCPSENLNRALLLFVAQRQWLLLCFKGPHFESRGLVGLPFYNFRSVTVGVNELQGTIHTEHQISETQVWFTLVSMILFTPSTNSQASPRCKIAVADQGFTVGGRQLVGGVDLPCGHFSVKSVRKNERIGSRREGGVRWARPPLDPPMYWVHTQR